MDLAWHQLGCPHLHWSRAFYRSGTGFPTHGHDFAECFLIEAGRGFQIADGVRVELSPGDLVFVHPEVVHSTAATADDSLVYVNLAIPTALHQSLHQRFFAGNEHWPWQGTAARQPIRLGGDDRHALNGWFEELERQAPDALTTEALLCDLLRRVRRQQRHDDRLDTAPPWLREAVAAFADPRHLGGGVTHLAALAGVSREHLSRAVRTHLACTASELVTELRLACAATQLLCSNRPIQDIFLDCGFGNLSHFHRVFRQHHGCTPRTYRQRHRQVVA